MNVAGFGERHDALFLSTFTSEQCMQWVKMTRRFWIVRCMTLLVLLSGESFAEQTLYARFMVHHEQRDEASENNFEVMAGWDMLTSRDRPLYAGLRAGIYRENVLTFSSEVSTKPFLGGHVYWLQNISQTMALKAGLAVDALKGDDEDPIYGYIGSELALCYSLSEKRSVEIPSEIGFFPGFDGTPYFAKIGVQIGLGF